METSYAQPNKFLNGFQNIQNAMMSTASKKNISNHKSQFMRKKSSMFVCKHIYLLNKQS